MTRVLLAGLFHETHCFVSPETVLADFDVVPGKELLAYRGNGSTIDGFLEVAENEGWDVIPACAYSASPAGIVTDGVVEAFWRDLRPVAAGGNYDAVFLNLHGAMVSRSCLDVEGEILERLRQLPGLGDIPIFGVFDLHANMTRKMASHANALICYRENPHIDARESAMRAAGLLSRCLSEKSVPRMLSRCAGIIWPPTGTGTADRPMRDLEAMAREFEQAHDELWAVNVVGGFSFADTPEAGVSFSVVTTGSDAVADKVLDALCNKAWELRHDGLPHEYDPISVLERIEPAGHDGPTILVEPSDNISGGAPGNGTGILRALLDTQTRNAAVVINDPQAVAELIDLAPGERRTLSIGGKDNPLDPGPVELELELVSASDGAFTVEDLKSHMVAARGKEVQMGPSVVARHDSLTILLTSQKTPPFDLGQWRSQGVEPADFSVIGVKAAVAHRRAYDRIAGASFTVETPGPCISDPRKLPYSRLRPCFPMINSRATSC